MLASAWTMLFFGVLCLAQSLNTLNETSPISNVGTDGRSGYNKGREASPVHNELGRQHNDTRGRSGNNELPHARGVPSKTEMALVGKVLPDGRSGYNKARDAADSDLEMTPRRRFPRPRSGYNKALRMSAEPESPDVETSTTKDAYANGRSGYNKAVRQPEPPNIHQNMYLEGDRKGNDLAKNHRNRDDKSSMALTQHRIG
ncbi:hypothetical protein VTI74DRAFT_601 [Chaetomium olivicolor]